jgi:RNA polymerase sigma-70 factor (ECF subfamily)
MRHLSASREDAEDLTQDVFVIAQTKAHTYAGKASLRTWLTQVAINALRGYRRREAVRHLLRMNHRATTDEVSSILDSEWLLQGIRKLSPFLQVTFVLHDVNGFSVREVAELTNCPEGTVKARLHYGRKRLKQLLICPMEEMK